ncbi:MAG: J domain-containing protein [Deltaproteobacteria bacterium]|nr:J domain-containing protein [Deltaproteobacteria bacterium]
MTLKDYYQILGVSKDSTSDDIRKAFRQLALRYHPDHNPENSKDAEEKFKEINEAYEVLGDDQKKREYDHLISWPSYRQKTVVVEDIFEDTFTDSIDLNLIREILQTFAELDPSCRVFSRRRSWTCQRQRGWRCRGRWWQD